MIKKTYLEEVLRNVAKQHVSESVSEPKKQDIKKLNKDDKTEMLQNEIDVKKPAVKDTTTKITNPKQIKSKIVKSVFEGLMSEFEKRYNLIKAFGNDEQISIAHSRILEMHGMASRFAHEYESRKLNFIPPSNVPQDDEDEDDDDDFEDRRDYDNTDKTRYNDFDDSSFRMSDDRYRDEDEGDEDFTNDDDNSDMDVDFGGAPDTSSSNTSEEPTAGDILNKVIDMVRENPDMRVIDAFSKVIGEFDVDYTDQDDECCDDDQDDFSSPQDDEKDSFSGSSVDMEKAKVAPGPSSMQSPSDNSNSLSNFKRF